MHHRLERTDEVARKIEKIINDTEGVAYSTMVVGYSMLTQSFSTNNAFRVYFTGAMGRTREDSQSN